MSLTVSKINGILGRIQDFTEGASIVGPPKAVPCRGVPGASSETQVLGNAISDVLRPTHGVLRSRFFKPFLLIFYNFFDVSGSNLGGSVEPL